MLPDPDQFCDCLRESFAELLAGALARNPKPVNAVAGRIPPARTAPVRRRKPASVSAAREDGAAASPGPAIPPKRKRTPGEDAMAKE